MHDAPPAESTPLVRIVESIPDSHGNVRLWVLLLIAWNAVFTVATTTRISTLSRGEQILLASALIELALWAVALHFWTKVRLAGFWMITILVHLLLVASGLAWWQGILSRACMFVFLLLCFPINIWAKETYQFFKRIDGRCPLCHETSLPSVKHKLDWGCPACHRTVLWRKVRRVRLQCPQCYKPLKGATTEMIGDTAVCPDCRTEFEISEPG